jgi:hypothetical protein
MLILLHTEEVTWQLAFRQPLYGLVAGPGGREKDAWPAVTGLVVVVGFFKFVPRCCQALLRRPSAVGWQAAVRGKKRGIHPRCAVGCKVVGCGLQEVHAACARLFRQEAIFTNGSSMMIDTTVPVRLAAWVWLPHCSRPLNDLPRSPLLPLGTGAPQHSTQRGHFQQRAVGPAG